MTDTQQSSANADSAPSPRARTPLRGWRDLWQIPVLLMATVLAIAGAMAWIGKSPGPDFESVLDDAERLIGRQRYDRSLEILNGPILEELAVPGIDEHILARFHSLRGDALYLDMHRRLREFPNELRATNHEKILAEYHEAEHLDSAQITSRRHAFMAEALLDLNQIEEALEHAEHLPHEMARRRLSLEKRIVEHLLSEPGGDAQRAAGELLESIRTHGHLEESDRLWLVARQAEIRLNDGLAGKAIDALLPEIQISVERESPEMGEIFLLLGRAYMEIGRFDRADEHLSRSAHIFGPGDERRGEADTMLARIAQTRGELEEARDRYSTVVERFPGTRVEAQALLGLGEIEADLGRYRGSIEAYEELVALLPEHADPRGVTAEEADLSMSQRHRARLLSHDYEIAIGYADLIERAYPVEKVPASAVERVAATHRALADHLLGVQESDDRQPHEILQVDSSTLETARRHYEMAGRRYHEHSTRTIVRDPELALRSMWRAADSFDRAGNQQQAIALFTEYMQSMRGDSRALRSKFRLARLFQSTADHETAINLYEELIRAHPGSDEAYRSYVPLAKTHLLRQEEGDIQRAEHWLGQVVSGRLFEPSAAQFREGLITLGRLYLSEGRFGEAIARFEEALDRYPDDSARSRIEFDLADALRLSATTIEKQLLDAMPMSDRTALEARRLERLGEALVRYENVRRAIEKTDSSARSSVDRVLLRNSSFYRADCAFDLGRFDEAIRSYDAAAQRYADETASLVAMVQIVNCYVALGRWREAQTAHARAHRRLRELPDGAWETGDIPMDRKHWEQWLESSIRIEQMSARAQAIDAEEG